MKWTLLILYFILLSSCNREINEQEILKIDSLLTIKIRSEHPYIDSLHKTYPNSDFIIGMKALSYISYDSLRAAEKLITSNLKKGNTFSLIAAGVLYDKKNDSVKAQDFFDQAIASDERRVNKWLRLYLFYHYKKDDLAKALENLDQAIQMDSVFNQAIIEKAYLLSPVDNCDSIIKLLNKVNRNYKDNGYLSFLGDAYYYCGDGERAVSCYLKSNEIKENGFAYFGLGTIEHYMNRNLGKASEFYIKSSEYSDTRCDAKISLGWLNFDKNNLDVAESYFREIPDLCAKQENYNELIYFYIKTGKLKNAKEYITLAEKRFSSSYFTEGFKLLIDVLSGDLEAFLKNNKIDSYYATYGKDAADWLNSLLTDINDLRKVRIAPDQSQKSI
jgi:tetratricopeptide (TPR) repeat protein